VVRSRRLWMRTDSQSRSWRTCTGTTRSSRTPTTPLAPSSRSTNEHAASQKQDFRSVSHIPIWHVRLTVKMQNEMSFFTITLFFQVIQALLSQGIITLAQYMSLMYMKSVVRNKFFKFFKLFDNFQNITPLE